ncbi:MAG: sulfatase [Thermoanaerobaculales bacterium]
MTRALIVGCVALMACSREAPRLDLGEIAGIEALVGRFSPSRSVVVIPDRFWEASSEKGIWTFQGWADLLCFVEESPQQGLQIVLEPDELTRDLHFLIRWDDVVLWEKPRTLAIDGEVIEIPRASLTPGLHRLTVGRISGADAKNERQEHGNGFARIEFRFDGTSLRIRPQAAERYAFLRAFLQDGVTGTGPEKLSGWLVEGPRTVAASMIVPEDSVVSFRLTNFGSSSSRFSLTVDGAAHSARVSQQPGSLEVPLPAGSHELSFAVDGAEDGLFLWGAPHLRPARRGAAGPVILVTMDTTRRDSLSPYGGLPEASPNIARLAGQATVYNNAWATSPWTLPSHASIFTGLYPTRHGAGVGSTRLDLQYRTLAEVFRDQGFRTAGFAGGEMSASHWGVAQGFELYRDPDGFETRGDQLTQFAVDYLEEHSDEPLFLFVNYFDPHALYRAPAEFEELFGVEERRDRVADLPVWGDLSRGDGAAWRAVANGEAEVVPEAVDYLRAAYLAEVAFMDRQVGRLIEVLEEHGLFDAATIVLVADHGEFLGEEGLFSHAGRLNPELTHIPLIIKWPGQTEPVRSDHLVSQVDLFATLVGAVDSNPSPMDGISLRPAHLDALAQRDTVFMEEHEMRIHPLFTVMKIAPNVYGIQQLLFRQIVWKGNTSCSRLTADGWRQEACTVGWQERMAELEVVAALPIEGDLEIVQEGLTDDLRRRLEALGYLR